MEVPKKNISSQIADIFRRPAAEQVGETPPEPNKVAETTISQEIPVARIDVGGVSLGPRHPIGRFVVIFLVLAGVGLGVFGVQAYRSGGSRFAQAADDLTKIQSAVPDIKNLDFESAQKKLLAVDPGLENPAPISNISQFFGVVGDALRGVGASYLNVREISRQSTALLGNLSTLEKQWPKLVFQNRGPELVKLLANIRDNLATLSAASIKITETTKSLSDFGAGDPGGYLDLQIGMNRAKAFLDTLIDYLDVPERHIAVFFQNSSELRPGGGFLGSYADLTVSHGSVTNIDVRDVNEPDREFTKNIVPPKPLQALVTRWRAADANWFFDFSVSAEKILSFFDASDLYAKQNIHFDAAIALTPEVVSGVLARTGPIKVSPALTIDKDNFLFQIQEEVQVGQAAKASAPKQILEKLAPLVVQSLTGTSTATGVSLADLQGWFSKKDVMVYFRDPTLEKFIDAYDLSGKVFEAPNNWNGDYLAVVSANIGGGKSDLFVHQDILLQSQIGADGVVTNHLEIKRTHAGKNAPGWWYQVTNQNYLQVFTVSDARITNAEGGIEKKITPQVNYTKAGYLVDPDVEAMQKTTTEPATVSLVTAAEEFGKKVFALWTKTPLGQSSAIALDYTHRMFTAPKDGDTYTFVMEKQSGASGSYHLEMNAPTGFRWKENNLPIYEYDTKDLPGRLMLTLTFEKVL